MTEKLIEKMIAFYQGNTHDIAHFLKVYAYARTIGLLEHLPPDTQTTLEAAAIVHDIACPLCREKFGSAAGNLQEQESPALLEPFLQEFNMPESQKARIIRLVSRHHTYTGVDGPDCQILLEADYLVNADEGGQSREAVERFGQSVFRTAAGKRLLEEIYLRER